MFPPLINVVDFFKAVTACENAAGTVSILETHLRDWGVGIPCKIHGKQNSRIELLHPMVNLALNRVQVLKIVFLHIYGKKREESDKGSLVVRIIMSELIKMFMDDDGNEVPEEKATRLNIVINIVTSNAYIRMFLQNSGCRQLVMGLPPLRPR